MTSLRGTVVVSSPGAPPVRATAPGGGRVLVSPGVQGPPGHGVNLAGAVPTYADLPALTVSDAGKAFMVQDDGRLYVWSGVSWPADGAGAQFRGETGPEGRGIRVVSVDGNDLVLGMSDGSTVRASVPALAAAVAARDVAVAARADAVSARRGAEDARDGVAADAGRAEVAAMRAEVAAGGVAADAAAAGDAAGRAEVARDQAAASAEAAAVDAAAVDDAREYVSGVHENWLPGGSARKTLDRLVSNTMEARSQALDARDDAQGHADRAEAAAAGVDQVVSDVTGVLAGKADTGHSHTIADVTGLHDALGGKAAVSHQHSWGDVTGKPTVYPPESHAHPSTQITDSTATGRAVLTASSAAAARQAIGAGTSNLALGTTSSTAAAGNHTHTQYATTAQVEARTPEIRTVSQLPASPSPGVVYIVMGA